MTWVSAIATFVLIWWIALFAVLPLWVTPDLGGEASGGWRGAPERPLLRRKLWVTTLLAAVLWAGWAVIVEADLISFRDGWLALPQD